MIYRLFQTRPFSIEAKESTRLPRDLSGHPFSYAASQAAVVFRSVKWDIGSCEVGGAPYFFRPAWYILAVLKKWKLDLQHTQNLASTVIITMLNPRCCGFNHPFVMLGGPILIAMTSLFGNSSLMSLSSLECKCRAPPFPNVGSVFPHDADSVCSTFPYIACRTYLRSSVESQPLRLLLDKHPPSKHGNLWTFLKHI